MKSQILGLIRHTLTTGGGYYAAKAGIDGDVIAEIVAGVVAIIGAVWSILAPEKKS